MFIKFHFLNFELRIFKGFLKKIEIIFETINFKFIKNNLPNTKLLKKFIFMREQIL